MGSRAQFKDPTSSNDISNFLAAFRTNEGVAQPNQYEVLILPPKKPARTRQNPSKRFIRQVLDDARDIQLRCESITLPGRNLSSTPDSNIHGPLREVVNNVNFDDNIAMVFQASADLRERVFFEKWQYTAFNPNTWNVGYYDDYIGEVDIYLLDRQNQRKYGLKLHECFPKSIGPTELSYATNNEIIRLPITMNFRYWTTLDITQETNALGVPTLASTAIEPPIESTAPAANVASAYYALVEQYNDANYYDPVAGSSSSGLVNAYFHGKPDKFHGWQDARRYWEN